jgi:hypothetical protein
MFYWRARAVQGTTTGAWSDTFQFKSKLVGYCRAGELYDPLIFGDKLDCAQFNGQPTFVPGKGLRLPNGQSYVIYTLPATITAGEFSVDIEGFVPGYTGDKGKVFAMGNGKGEFTTNDYRYDIQYRGNHGDPVGGIVFRAVFGDAVDTSVRYESNEERHDAAFVREGMAMNPAFTYFWKTTWGSEVRLVVKDGGASPSGINGREIYNVAKSVKKGVYNPAPHLAYLGAPPNSNGAESATIPGLTYRNVYIGSKPRPDTLGSALR